MLAILQCCDSGQESGHCLSNTEPQNLISWVFFCLQLMYNVIVHDVTSFCFFFLFANDAQCDCTCHKTTNLYSTQWICPHNPHHFLKWCHKGFLVEIIYMLFQVIAMYIFVYGTLKVSLGFLPVWSSYPQVTIESLLEWLT